MLVNAHKPIVSRITTHGAGTSDEFHTVVLLESHGGTHTGEVALFISADWSQWDAIVDKVTEHRQVSAVRALGTKHGTAAGSWVVDGNTVTTVLGALASGEAELEIPDPLDGYEVSAADVYEAAGVEVDENGDGPDWLLVEYENAFQEAYEAEVVRSAASMLPDDVDA
jgi:hypothetical protein